ncbi:hypothetical protein [Crenobacter cavernae]|uniref:hypothetical protein n=1 Tax=Crenobacter cavernae TaxID=2290923 RepID=UPI001419AB74|nr:hypothetical protein [Crenobacter cavernae]
MIGPDTRARDHAGGIRRALNHRLAPHPDTSAMPEARKAVATRRRIEEIEEQRRLERLF